MKKVFSLFAAMLVAFGMSAQTTLIDYQHTDQLPAGVTISGSTTVKNVRIHTNTDGVNCIQLANGYTSDNKFNSNAIVLKTEGGFKAGDVLTIAGFFNNTDETKQAQVQLFTVNDTLACTAVWTSAQVINGRTSAGDPVEESYTLTADMDSILLGRLGNTGTNLYTIKVVRPENQGGGDEYVVDGFLAGKLTPATPASLATGLGANNRGGFALREEGLYFCNNSNGIMSKMELDLSAINAMEEATAPGYYMMEDEAGNIVIWEWNVGSAIFNRAQVLDANLNLVRKDSLPITGRADMPSVIGNVLVGQGAYFVYPNEKSYVLRYNLVDGAVTTVDTIAVPFAGNSLSFVSPLDANHFLVQSRSTGLAYVDASGETPVVTNMSQIWKNAYGATIFKFAGHTLMAIGTVNYLGSFDIYDITDPAKPYVIASETTAAGTAALGTACVNFRVKVDGETATLYEHAAQVVRKYTLTVTPACYIKQGNEGAEWTAMTAGENGFTYDAVLAADSLYINGAAADAGAIKFHLSDATVNGTVAVNDTVRFTYNNGVLTIDSLGHFVPTLTFNVKVPAVATCYIAGNFTNWGFVRMAQLTDTTYTYTYRAEDALAASVAYKYVAGPDWAYVEKGASGEELGNRAYAEYDTVATWASVPTVNTITYELNGGVMNDFGWTSKGAIALELQNDYNAAYSASKEWAKLEDGKYYYHIGENWVEENAAAGQASTVAGFIQNVTYNTNNNLKTLVETTQATKYAWLVEVIKANRAAMELPIDEANMSENVYRKELSGFFLASPAESSWPAASNFTATAGADFFMPIWKHALSNPETVTAAFTLNAPYKEGFTFDGWYANVDFSGEQVTTIDENTPSCTLYAKWIEYISTIAEATAAQGDTVKTAGVVTYVNKSNVYIQDATGATLLYMAKGATAPKVGDKVTVKGKSVMYHGAPEIQGAVITATVADQTLPAAAERTLSSLTAEGAALKVFGQRVKVLGVKIAKYDSNGNAFVTDGIDTVQCYYMTPDQTVFPIGIKVNLTAIVGYYDKFQFVGDVAGFEIVTLGKKDAYNYPARVDNRITLENKWIISNKEDNFASNKPAGNDYARAMVAKNGIMYFPDREHAQLTRIDAATGEMLAPLPITGEHLFEAANAEGTYAAAVTLPFNDLKIDNAGHLLLGACVAGGQHFMVYKVDETTGAATLVVDERLYDNEDFGEELQGQATAWRFDAFGVYGDVDNSAIIMGADANSFNVYKWTITNGEAGKAEKIDASIDPENDESLLIVDGAVSVASFSYAPQIFPISEDFFYVDGWNTLPMLYDMDGVLADDFIHCPTGLTVVNNPGDTIVMNQGHNGLCEFEVNGEYFLVMAARNTVPSNGVASAFALYKFADEARAFDGMEPLWYFPANGMGEDQVGARTAVPSVEVNAETGVATIYVYTLNNGYGVYEMTVTPATGINDVEAAGVVTKVVRNNQVVIIKNGVHYNVLGTIIK